MIGFDLVSIQESNQIQIGLENFACINCTSNPGGICCNDGCQASDLTMLSFVLFCFSIALHDTVAIGVFTEVICIHPDLALTELRPEPVQPSATDKVMRIPSTAADVLRTGATLRGTGCHGDRRFRTAATPAAASGTTIMLLFGYY